MMWAQQRTESAMFLRRRRSHLTFSNTADNRPGRDVLQTETPVDHANLDVVLNVALRAAVYGTGAAGAAIALMRDGQLVCRAREGDIAPDLGVVLNVDTGITGACVRRAQVLHCQDAETDGRVDSAVCRTLGIRSILVVPIVVNGAVTGILEILASNDHAFNSEHIKWLTIVANFVHANTRATERVPEAKTLPSRVTVRHGLLEPASISVGIQSSQGPGASAEDPGLDALIGALQESSPGATWDVICEQLASRFR
jgi:putative methionine-R-sulfoxide reductase with GAF domain